MPTHKNAGQLSAEKKIYQLIISRIDGERIREAFYREKIFGLVKKGIGGFILFGGWKEEVKSFIRDLQASAEVPLFIASDVERGICQQIQGTTPLPCQMAVSAAVDISRPDDVFLFRESLRVLAEEAGDIGINMPLIPVLDVNRDPDNPIICTRAFSDDPERVAWFGSEYIRILERAGLITSAKHFPGHGDTSTDSHIRLPVIRKSRADLMDTDIAPFRKAIRTGAGSIMVGHLSIPSIDANPASLSGKILTDLLRHELGFEGLILTDALIMSALNDIANVPARCIDAGADILLHPADPDATAKELLAAVAAEGTLRQKTEAAFTRIATIKTRLHGAAGREVDYRRNMEISAQLVQKSISLVQGTIREVPAADKRRLHLILAGDPELYAISSVRKYFPRISTIDEEISLENRCPVFAVFTSVAAWKGSSGISDAKKEKILRLIQHAGCSVVISFGSPYVLRHFRDARVLIAAYEATEQAQDAVMKCLEGRSEFSGIVPVELGT